MQRDEPLRMDGFYLLMALPDTRSERLLRRL